MELPRQHFPELCPAAEGLLPQQGYNGFSYDHVAQQAGIKKPSVHQHFATKADLAGMVVQRYTHRFREALLRFEGQHAGARKRLAACAELFDRTFARERRLCVCGMLGAEVHDLPEAVRGEVARFFGINLRWLQAAFERRQHARGAGTRLPVRTGRCDGRGPRAGQRPGPVRGRHRNARPLLPLSAGFNLAFQPGTAARRRTHARTFLHPQHLPIGCWTKEIKSMRCRWPSSRRPSTRASLPQTRPREPAAGCRRRRHLPAVRAGQLGHRCDLGPGRRRDGRHNGRRRKKTTPRVAFFMRLPFQAW